MISIITMLYLVSVKPLYLLILCRTYLVSYNFLYCTCAVDYSAFTIGHVIYIEDSNSVVTLLDKMTSTIGMS